MGMSLFLREASDLVLRKLLRHPEELENFLEGAGRSAATLSRMAALDTQRDGNVIYLGKKPTTQPEPAVPTSEPDELDLHKYWHGLHYLLTGTAWEGDAPANGLLLGGTSIGDTDLGYGPARAMMADEVQQFERFLSQMKGSELKERYNLKKMVSMGIYPYVGAYDVPSKADSAEEFEFLAEYFQELKDFCTQVARANHGLVLYMA